MDTGKLEQIIAEEVLKHLKGRDVKPDIPKETGSVSVPEPEQGGEIAVILFGGHAGFTGLCMSLKSQIDQGRKIVIHQSTASKKIHNKEILQKEVPGIRFAPDLDLKNISDFKVMVLGCLTRTSAAKISLGITDTLETIMVYTALARGIPVIATSESLNNPECDYCGGNIPYLAEISEKYRYALTEMGVIWLKAEGISEQLDGYWSTSADAVQPSIKGVVTVEDVVNWDQKEFWVMPGTILTAMARDLLNEKNVAIKEK